MPIAAFTAVPGTVTPMAVASEYEPFPIRGLSIDGNLLIPTDRILNALNGYLGEGRTAVTLLQARDAVYRLYREAGYEMVSVEPPSEIGTDGIVRLRVLERTIGSVTVSGNGHYSSEYFRSILPSLQEKHSPNLAGLARELFLANDHSGHQLALSFTPEVNGHADVEIKVKDSSPLRAMLSADNTGTQATGRSRATLTAFHANLWGLGHEAAAGYTTSPELPGKVRQLFLSYQLLLPALADRLQFGYSYSNTDAGRIEDFNISGQGSSYSLRLQHDLQRSANSRHLIEFGIEDKRYKNTIDYLGFGFGAVNVGVDVNARPVSVNYRFTGRDGASSASATIGYARNLPGGARNDDQTYGASRGGARSSWSVWRANAQLMSASASQWALHTAIDAQYTAETLISDELFGVGGARSVRGFQERETSGERGWRATSEVLFPPLAKQHRFLAFFDAGRNYRVNPLPGDLASTPLMSYGMGWRWARMGSIYTSLDWARVAKGTAATPKGSNALHFSANWQFI